MNVLSIQKEWKLCNKVQKKEYCNTIACNTISKKYKHLKNYLETPFSILFSLEENESNDIYAIRCNLIKEMLKHGANPHFVCKRKGAELLDNDITPYTKLCMHNDEMYKNSIFAHKCIDLLTILLTFGINSFRFEEHIYNDNPLQSCIEHFIDTPAAHKYPACENETCIGYISWNYFIHLLQPYKNKLFYYTQWFSVEYTLLPSPSNLMYTMNEQRERLRDILLLGGNPDAESDDVSLMVFAIKDNDIETCKLLLEMGADPTRGRPYLSEFDHALGLDGKECKPTIFRLLLSKYPSIKYVKTLQYDWKPVAHMPKDAKLCIMEWLWEHPEDLKTIHKKHQKVVKTWLQ